MERLKMKAAILSGYRKKGGELTVCEVPVPEIRDNEVLVKIKTAGVNPLDNMIVRGEVKLVVPYKFPLVMGNEFCSVIEKVGKSVVGFTIGDRVYGRMPLKKIGAYAEYAAVAHTAIAKVPSYLSDEEAACVPLTALTALQALDLMNVRAGKTLFISGGTRSFGAMAIPIAKSMGLTVITNSSAENKDRVMKLGADRFIDYKTEDYTRVLSDIDYVIDTLGVRELEREFGVLKRGGALVSLRGLPNGEFAARMNMSPLKKFIFGVAGRKFDKIAARKKQKYYFIFVREDGKGLQKVSDILQDKKIQPSVDKVYRLSEVNQALAKVASGGSKGKTVIKIG